MRFAKLKKGDLVRIKKSPSYRPNEGKVGIIKHVMDDKNFTYIIEFSKSSSLSYSYYEVEKVNDPNEILKAIL